LKTTVFDGDDYQVIYLTPEEKRRETILFTMNSWSKDPGFHNAPFAASVAIELGMDFLGVVPKHNCWWQKREFQHALSAIAKTLENRSSLAYGGSMGAYGIINISTEVEMSRGLAFVPQISIDPSIVPFENRWNQEAAALEFNNDLIKSSSIGTPFTVIYDDAHALDRQHIDLLKPRMRCSEFISLPGSGHNPAAMLLEQGKLKRCVTDWILTGSWDDDQNHHQ